MRNEELSVSATPARGQRVLVVDNLDSFTGSIVQYLRLLGADVVCLRADEVGDPTSFDRIVLSPGPGRPEDFPVNQQLARDAVVPLLGVCLGLQALVLAWGGVVGPAREIVHGRTSRVRHDGTGLFRGLPSPFRATRYHSLAATRLPPELIANAWTADGTIMGIRHRSRPFAAVQFHPESVASEHGLALFANFFRATEPSGPRRES